MTYPGKVRLDIEERTRAVLYDFRQLLTEERQKRITDYLTERHYAVALLTLRVYLTRHAENAEDEGVRLQIQLRRCDIDVMLAEIEAARRAEEAKNQPDADDRLARIEDHLNEAKAALDWLARRNRFQHWGLVLMGGAIGAMAGVMLAR